jgi:hypothetical protein
MWMWGWHRDFRDLVVLIVFGHDSTSDVGHLGKIYPLFSFT